MLHVTHAPRIAMLLLMSFAAAGCGGEEIPELAPVTGTVTLDGTPLAGAQIQFEPTGAGPSFGTTDQSGRYQLQYGSKHPGAAVGSHVVRIRHYGDNPEVPQEGKVPAHYGNDSILKYEVKPDQENVADFKLTSGRQ